MKRCVSILPWVVFSVLVNSRLSSASIFCEYFPQLCNFKLPTPTPSAVPSISSSPSLRPTLHPTESPSPKPSLSPTQKPSSHPTSTPTQSPTDQPSASPTSKPSTSPTQEPSSEPSLSPTSNPTNVPTKSPTVQPSDSPSSEPSTSPTQEPSSVPSLSPTSNPTNVPTRSPTVQPSDSPSSEPSASPTQEPSSAPSLSPSSNPTQSPTIEASDSPSSEPSSTRSKKPSSYPSPFPTQTPSIQLSTSPSIDSTSIPTLESSDSPTSPPSPVPTSSPTQTLSEVPIALPSVTPTNEPFSSPTSNPTTKPTNKPTITSIPSSFPSIHPTSDPTTTPTRNPSQTPSIPPSKLPTTSPTTSPSDTPSEKPSLGPRPNVIVMMTDQHSYRTLGCYRDYLISKGQTEQAFVWGPGVAVETPNLDRLATEGVLFTNFHTTSPLCTPNRGSFLSGLYPARNGADQNNAAMNEDVVTFAEVLREKRDYNTAYFGKWHLNGNKKPAWGEDSNFYDFGFKDIKHLFNKGHWKFIEEQKNGKMRAYTYADGKRKFKGKEDKHFTTDYLFDRGIEFMEKSRQQGEPFLTFLSIPDPHAPKDVRPPYDTMFNHFTFQLPYTARTAARRAPASPGWNDHDYLSVPLDDTEDYLDDVEKRTFYQESLRSYFGMVKCIDDNVGKLFSYLDSAGIDDDTIIVFTSDHGDMLSEHGKFNKNTPFRTSAGIPFMIRSPNKIAAGKIVETAYSSVDFAPSILSLLGVTDTNVDFQGLDFSEELLNNDIVPTKDVIRYVFQSGSKGNWAAAVMNQYKLVVSLNSVPWLFDLDQDPYEIINHINDKSIPIDVKQKLQDGLYNAMIEFEIPLQTSAKWGSIYFNPPVCIDSKDRLPTEELAGLCTDVGKSIPITETCAIQKFQNHCPVTCGTCCADSDGPLWSKGDLLSCEDLSNIGRCNGKSQTFCNISCNQCSA